MIALPIRGLHTPDSVPRVRIGPLLPVPSQTRALRCPYGLDNTNAGVFTLGQAGGHWGIVNYTSFNAAHDYTTVYTGRRNAGVRTAWTVVKKNLNLFSIHRATITISE